jgi:hypothetical protein
MSFACRVESYSPLAYANLRELESAQDVVDNLMPLINLLGDIITRYRMESYVGVALLHKHFNLFEDERLVRTFEHNIMTIAPSGGHHSLAPFVWAFTKVRRGDEFSCIPVEFIRLTQVTAPYADEAQAVEQNTPFLTEYFHCLSKHGGTPYLGLGLIVGKPFTFDAGDRLVEKEKPGRMRQLTLRPLPAHELDGVPSTQTLWTF